MEAAGSVLTNKYAEGYPGKRYYGGCHVVDVAEALAINRAKQMFGCDFANVQPHSGSQANQGVFLAVLKPGDTILGMGIDAGGHLTHGAAPNVSGKWFNAVHYGVRRDDGFIDYEQVERQAREHKPRLIIAGGSAYARIIDFKRFRQIADEVGALLLVDMAHFAGLVAGRRASEPLPARSYCNDHDPQDPARPTRRDHPHKRPGPRQEDQLRHLPRPAGRTFDAHHRRESGRLWRGAAAGIQGLRARGREQCEGAGRQPQGGRPGTCFGRNRYASSPCRSASKRPDRKGGGSSPWAAHITVNKNGVPFDPQKPTITSGIRVGSPAGTTRGFGTEEFSEIGDMIGAVLDGLKAGEDKARAAAEKVKAEAIALCNRFPIYPGSKA